MLFTQSRRIIVGLELDYTIKCSQVKVKVISAVESLRTMELLFENES